MIRRLNIIANPGSNGRASFATVSSRQSAGSFAQGSHRSSVNSTLGSSFGQILSPRSSTSSVPPIDENSNERQDLWQANRAESAHPPVDEGYGIASREPECRYLCTNGFCKVTSKYGRRSSHERHVGGHWSTWYCFECLSPARVQEWLSKVGCQCDMATYPYPGWYHLEVHRIQLEYGNHESLAHGLERFLAKASFTRKASLARHLEIVHRKDPEVAKACLVHFKKFATCGICQDDVLFTDWKTEAAHLWNVHWMRRHDMEMWDTDREIWKLINLRPGVYTAWQELLQHYRPGSKQDHVSWKHRSPPAIKKLLYVLGVNFLSDQQIAKKVFDKVKFTLSISASQMFPDDVITTPLRRKTGNSQHDSMDFEPRELSGWIPNHDSEDANSIVSRRHGNSGFSPHPRQSIVMTEGTMPLIEDHIDMAMPINSDFFGGTVYPYRPNHPQMAIPLITAHDSGENLASTFEPYGPDSFQIP